VLVVNNTNPTNSGTVVENALIVPLGVFAVTTFSQINRLFVPPSMDRKKRIMPAVVVPVAVTTTFSRTTPLVVPVVSVPTVPVPSRFVLAVDICIKSGARAVDAKLGLEAILFSS
jgi:hypothetical protein